MLKYMLDTNICIFTIKNKPNEVREAFNRYHGYERVRNTVPSICECEEFGVSFT